MYIYSKVPKKLFTSLYTSLPKNLILLNSFIKLGTIILIKKFSSSIVILSNRGKNIGPDKRSYQRLIVLAQFRQLIGTNNLLIKLPY